MHALVHINKYANVRGGQRSVLGVFLDHSLFKMFLIYLELSDLNRLTEY